MRAASDRPADTTMMGVVHDALRRDLARLTVALSETPPPGTRRREALADHVLWMMDFLHHHHETEDVGLWPLVRSRNPDAAALLDRMDAEHAGIAAGIHAVVSAAQRYRTDPSEEARGGILRALSDLSTPLRAHLEDEEVSAMPVVSASISDAEWRHWDQTYNVRGKSLSRLGAEGHWLMDSLDPDRYQVLMHLVPAPVRFVLLTAFAHRYRTACALRWGADVPAGPLSAVSS
jgi:hemerythrin-like domain-containing protein